MILLENELLNVGRPRDAVALNMLAKYGDWGPLAARDCVVGERVY